MGKRRVRCLLANGIPAANIVVFDARADRLHESRDKYSVATAKTFKAAIRDPGIAAVFVSVPGALHIKYCLAAARAGKHWFCEVPLAVNSRGIAELKELTQAKQLIGAPGCQVLFHPLGRALQEWAAGPLGGPILAASYSFGSYLPEWHPHEDYRQFYASNKAMGGGNLDVIAQEMVWIRSVINRSMVAVSCRTSKTSALELAEGTPDHQEIIIEFEGGLMLSAHFDLLDRSHEGMLRLVTAASTLKWNKSEKALEVYEPSAGAWKRHPQADNYNYETCYQEEIGRFLTCIEKREAWPVRLETAEEIVRLLHGLDRSDRRKRSVPLVQEVV